MDWNPKHTDNQTSMDSDPMTMPIPRNTIDPPEREIHISGSAKTALLIAIICLAVISMGAAGYIALVKSTPKVHKRPPAKMVPLVGVQKIYPQTQQVVVRAMGTVIPAKELTLKSRVAGEIVEVHPEFTEGGILRKKEQIIKVDDVDYKLIAAQKQSAVAHANYELKLELGRQDVAQREWELLNGNNPAPEADAELALRKPHLEKSQSDLIAAKAELETAKLQLARTRITAPFNAVVRTTHVEKGSQIAIQENLATLVGTDEYWVQVSIPVDRLKWIDIPSNRSQDGAEARITYHGDFVRKGHVVKLLSDLEAEGRMARLVVAVQDPLGLNSAGDQPPAMLIGEYVRVDIQGHSIPDAFRIPRSALRDNSKIWLAGSDGKLEIREVQTIWRDTETVLVKDGLKSGAKLVITDLATPVQGMAIKVDNGRDQPL